MEAIPGVILAGGRSRRMGGGDKALAGLAGLPMIGHAIARLAPQLGALAINTNSDPAPYERFGLPLLADSLPDRPGPLAGVLAAMEWAAQRGAETVLTAAADMPFLPQDLAARLADPAGRGRIVAARSAAGLQPVCALWPTALAADLCAWLEHGESRKARAFILAQPHLWIDFPAPPEGAPDPFFNANTPEDLARAASALADAKGPCA